MLHGGVSILYTLSPTKMFKVWLSLFVVDASRTSSWIVGPLALPGVLAINAFMSSGSIANLLAFLALGTCFLFPVLIFSLVRPPGILIGVPADMFNCIRGNSGPLLGCKASRI